MNHRRIVLLLLTLLTVSAGQLSAQDDYPSIDPKAYYTKADGTEEESASYSDNAPLQARFEANATNTAGWTAYYEWHFTKEGETTPYLIRYEEDTRLTFVDAGTHIIQLYAIFTQGNDTVAYTDEYWAEVEPLRVTINESKLEMPNAFSPNSDDKNKIYRAKPTYQSIVEFHAAIFNRWGQKLYEWDDPAGGWDGTFNGHPVAQGVYFVVVRAKGADGHIYNIRRDVNLLRGYTESTTNGSTGP
ncbi:MAG: gliding motility-associated C-terminal domain-containing protein [Prevotella sp.]|nr:gliding motility-associated C-terminal domain-containing protein [Prevotella sp.]